MAGLFDFLLKMRKFLGVEELDQGDAKAVAEHLECYDAGVLAFSVKDILMEEGATADSIASLWIDMFFSPSNCKILFFTVVYVSIFVLPCKIWSNYSPKPLTKRAIYDTI